MQVPMRNRPPLRRMALPCVGLALALAAQTALGQDGTYTVIGGAGLVTCERWLEISDNDTLRVLDRHDLAEEQVKAWVAGYLSAYNRFVLDEGSVTEGRSPEALLAWADRFCEANKGATMATLAEVMVQELKKGRE